MRTIIIRSFFLLAVCLAQAQSADPKPLVEKAIQAVGGKDKLLKIYRLKEVFPEPPHIFHSLSTPLALHHPSSSLLLFPSIPPRPPSLVYPLLPIGFTRRFDPLKPVTRAQAAAALACGDSAELLAGRLAEREQVGRDEGVRGGEEDSYMQLRS